MFVPIPTADICDMTSRSSRCVARAVCRPWRSFDSTTWHLRPETIDLRPDGTGEVRSRFSVYTAKGRVEAYATQRFAWRLSWDGPRGMEDMDENALYETMPKLMQSTEAWTRRPWAAEHRLVPAYLHIELVGEHSLREPDPMHAVDDFTTDPGADGVHLPPELIEDIMTIAASEEVAASDLLRVCKWTRELVLKRRRRERFSGLTKRFAALGLAFWMTCGHFNPTSSENPTSFFVFRAQVFKFPEGQFDARVWDTTWDARPLYYAGELPVPAQPQSAFEKIREGVRVYDAHPEVRKDYEV